MYLKTLLFMLVFWSVYSVQLHAQWTPLGSGVEASNQVIFNISAVNEDVIWAISSAFPELNDRLVRTTDGGQSWTAMPFNIDSNLYAISLHAMDSVNAWLATADEQTPIAGKVYKTTDGGQTWEEKPDAFTGFNETPAGIYFWNENKGVAFGATCADEYDDQIAIYYTEDGGDNWTAVSGDAMPDQLPSERMCLPGGNGYYEVVGDNIWFLSYQGRVFKSADCGKTWEAHYVVPDGGAGLVSSIAFKDALNGVASIFPNSVAFTSDGGVSWSQSIALPFEYRVAQIEYVPDTEGTYIIGNGYIGDDTELGVSYDNGLNWELLEANANLDCHQFISPSIGFAGGTVTSPDSGGIYKWEGGALTNTRAPKPKALLQVFPNPAKSKMQIQVPDWPADGLLVKLYNLQGQLLRQTVLREQDHIDVHGLQSGLYNLVAVKGKQTYIGQFMKL